MSMDQSQLNRELVQFLQDRQNRLEVVKTTSTPGGQTLDWVPIESQTPDGKIASPPATDKMPAAREDPQKPVSPASLELDDKNVERGPEGTIPIVRPSLSHLTTTVKLQDYLAKRGGIMINKHRPNKKPTDPNPFGYFHAASGQSTTAYG
jgi:hypothetical protein